MAIRSENAFTALAAIGLTFMMMLQVLINVWVVLDLMPVTGQGLPLIGHGGTSIVITSLYMGVLLALSNDVEKRKEMEKEILTEDETNLIDDTEDELTVIDLEDELMEDDLKNL